MNSNAESYENCGLKVSLVEKKARFIHGLIGFPVTMKTIRSNDIYIATEILT